MNYRSVGKELAEDLQTYFLPPSSSLACANLSLQCMIRMKSFCWLLTFLTIVWVVGGNFTHCFFSLNNSETVKAVALVICRIQWQYFRDIRAECAIRNSPQSPHI